MMNQPGLRPSVLQNVQMASPPLDPDNFRLLADCLTIVVASAFGYAFSPAVQATWQKFLFVVVAALSSRYF